ncbi:MAG: DUF4126 domain-containing protein [Gemmatimonadota bacterium]|jgi:hypothetical protein
MIGAGSLVLIGQTLGLSFACGLNLYATVVVLGILARFDLVAGMPAGLRGLGGILVIASAAALFIVEAVIDKVRHADSLWDAVHTFIRPSAAAMLAVAALWPYGLEVKAAGALLGALVALTTHGTKAGLRMVLHNNPRPRTSFAVSIVEDVLAITLTTAALLWPVYATAGAGGALLIILVFGHRFWRAFTLGLRALIARLRSMLGTSGWHPVEDLPRDVRGLIGPTPIGAAEPRAARVGITGLKGVGAYRSGWLVISDDALTFAYRSLLGARSCALPRSTSIEHEKGLWTDVVQVQADDVRYTLYLLKDGPGADLALAGLKDERP